MRRCFLILIDGLRPDLLAEEASAGRLPNLAKLTDGGTRTRAVTVFPSTTTVAYLPFLTGRTPGECNVPSIRWLDRSTYRGRWWRDRSAMRSYCGYQAGMVNGDVAPHVATIFEIVPDSVAIFSPVTRGLARQWDLGRTKRQLLGTLTHFTEWHQPADDAVAASLLQAVDTPARFVFAQFPGVDGYSHAESPDGPRVRRALRRIDSAIGSMIRRLTERGEHDDTLFLVVSDHGAAPVRHHLDLVPWFEHRGASVLSHPTVWRKQPHVAVMVAGNSAAAIYADPSRRRDERVTLESLRTPGALGIEGDAVAALVAETGIALVAGVDDQRNIRVMNRAGEARISAQGDSRSYQRISGDPLQVAGDVTATSREWLSRTFDTDWPDTIENLVDQFSAPRTGDLILAAADGWDFRDRWEIPEHHAGHGSLTPAHMLTPLWSNRRLRDGAWRTADIFPVMLEWMGITPPA